MDKTTVTNMSPGKNDSGASKITGSDEKVWTIFPFKAVLFQVNMKIFFNSSDTKLKLLYYVKKKNPVRSLFVR